MQVGEALLRQLAGLLQTLEQCLCGGFTGTGGVPALKVISRVERKQNRL